MCEFSTGGMCLVTTLRSQRVSRSILTSWIAEIPELLAATEEIIDCFTGVTSFVA